MLILDVDARSRARADEAIWIVRRFVTLWIGGKPCFGDKT